MALEHAYIVRADDGADIAVWENENPVAGRQSIGVVEMAPVIHQIAVRADDRNTQPGPWRKSGVVSLVAEQCPVGSPEQ